MIKTCRSCGTAKPLQCFREYLKQRAAGLHVHYGPNCKECMYAKSVIDDRTRYAIRSKTAMNPEGTRVTRRRAKQAERYRVLRKICQGIPCCKICRYSDDPRGLVIDHVDGGGKEDRESLKNGCIIRRVVQTGDTSGLQVLCGTCHLIKRVESGEQIDRMKKMRLYE